MLTPCNPCICVGAPCEQCMFGYQSNETNHRTMKDIIERADKGEVFPGHGLAETYKRKHPDWEEQMNLYSEAHKPTSNTPEQYKTCGRCIHEKDYNNDIFGSTCYLCRRNPTDNRIDWFERDPEV